MDKNRIEDQEFIESIAFLYGKRATDEELVTSFRETAEEMSCFSF